MKTTLKCLVPLLLLISCSGNDVAPFSKDYGTFQGSIQVVDDPSTQLGYIENAKVSVAVNGAVANIKIKGDLGFEREFLGKVSSAQTDFANVSFEQQTKPTEKITAGYIVIDNNSLTITLSIANDQVSVRNSTASATIVIDGKLSMIGTDLLKQ